MLGNRYGRMADGEIRLHLNEAFRQGVRKATARARKAGKNLGKIEVKSRLVGNAVDYVLAQLPDGVRRLKLSRQNVENLVRRLLPEKCLISFSAFSGTGSSGS